MFVIVLIFILIKEFVFVIEGYFGDVNKGIYKFMGNVVVVKICNEMFI